MRLLVSVFFFVEISKNFTPSLKLDRKFKTCLMKPFQKVFKNACSQKNSTTLQVLVYSKIWPRFLEKRAENNNFLRNHA